MTADREAKREVCGSSTSRVLLASWAAVATALFIFTLLFGALYVVNHQDECDKNTDVKNMDLKLRSGESEETETIHEDKEKHTDFIIKRNSVGDISLIVGVDYNKKLSVAYIPRADMCVLATGEDLDWFDDAEDSKNTTIEVNEDDTVVCKVDLNNKMTDLTLLTTEMQAICRGKHMYWASDEKDEQLGEREKRGCYHKYNCYYYRCWRWGWCQRCFYLNLCYIPVPRIPFPPPVQDILPGQIEG